MRVAGLFSGIGGFELAFAQAGFKPTLLAEIDPDAHRVLNVRFPDIELFSDVRDHMEISKDVSVLTAGFPCQNLSMAGDKTGIDGQKSGIVSRMFELIGQSSIPTIVVENVYFMLQLDRGRGMHWLVQQFEVQGYKWAYRVLDTMGFGLPQRRRRVYLVASKELDPRCVLFADQAVAAQQETVSLARPVGFYWTEGRTGVGLTADGIPPLKVGSSVGIPSAPAVLFPDGEVLMPSLRACELLQGFPAGWTTVDGAPPRSRRPEWRLIGNAVSVPVAHWVAGRVMTPGQLLDFPHKALEDGQRWPDAAWNVGSGRFRVEANDTPKISQTPSISTFRDSAWTRLSDRALDGYIKRVVAGGLRVPPGFVEALRAAERKIVRAA
ncbi:DNA (cytosine-5)-methyltransferase 1 [Bradyrhizobium sp. USDA 4011]